MKTTLLSTAYLPPIEYILKCLQTPVMLEVREHYTKQSYRNRSLIATANGVQALTIPVVHVSSKMPILDVRIDYAMPWQRLHWKSLDTAYNSSPYFLYFQDYIRPFYEKRYEFLFDFNLELMQVILKLFGNHAPNLLHHLAGSKILRLVTALETICKLIHLIVFQQDRLNIQIPQLVVFNHRLGQRHFNK